jgi:hypothetical protein
VANRGRAKREERHRKDGLALAPARRSVGRPSKLTPERYETLLRVLAMGNYRCVAARCVHINPATLSRWLADPRPRYVAFREAVEHSEAIAAVQIVANVVKLSRSNARAGIWWLELRYPAEWGPHARREAAEEARPDAGLADGSKWIAVPMPPGLAEKYGIEPASAGPDADTAPDDVPR